MLRFFPGKSVYTVAVAASATLAFRLILGAFASTGVLMEDNIPGPGALCAFYLFFVAVVWLGQQPHRNSTEINP